MTTHKQVSFGNEINRTSDILVLSTIHGRQRRSERDLTKRDLQAAVKYGKKERGYADRHGRPRWMFTFADIVYITDSTCTVEITSYPLPIHVAAAPITREMCKIHAAALLAVEIPRTWTSHTVLVVDQSGSMKKPDIWLTVRTALMRCGCRLRWTGHPSKLKEGQRAVTWYRSFL